MATDSRIAETEDYILSAKYGNSMSRALHDRPNGFPTKQVAKMLGMTEAEINSIITKILRDIRDQLD